MEKKRIYLLIGIIVLFSFTSVSAFNFGDTTVTSSDNYITLINNNTELFHNNMSGIQGGVANQYYHIRESWYNELSSDILDWITQAEGDIRYYPKSNPYSFYNLTNPQTETDSLAYNGSLYLSSNPYLFYNSTNPQTETDPLWTSNQSLYSTTTQMNTAIESGNTSLLNWVVGQNYLDTETDSLAYNGSLYLSSNPYSFYNSTNPQTETDPVWTADKTDYSTTTEANNLYSEIEWGYNQTTPAINKILTFNYYNSSDFNIGNYYLKTNPYSFYNSTTLGNDYYLKTNPFGFYNLTDFSIGDYTLTTTINGYSLSHWSDDLGDRGYTNNLNFTNGAGYYNSSDFDIGDYYLDSNPYSFYNSTNPQTETDSLAYNGSLYLSSNPYLFINTTSASDLNNLLELSGENITSGTIGYARLPNLDYLVLVKWVNISDAPTTLGFFTDDLGNRGYTHLSNFTDDLGNRGYTSLSNFSNDLGIGNWTLDKVNYYVKSDIDTNISSANTSMKNYVDAVNISQSTWTSAEIISANTSSTAYTDSVNSSQATWTSTEIVNANTTMKNYADGTFSPISEPLSLHLNQDNWYNDSDNYLNWDGDSLEFNQSKLSTTYFDASAIQVVTGTPSGTLADIQTYNGVTYNITEVLSDYELRVNFTGITDFTTLIIRHKTNVANGHVASIQIWDYTNSVWEGYGHLTESLTSAIKTLGVLDASDHIGTGANEGIVQVRFFQEGVGNSLHIQQFDYVGLSKGFGTPAGQEIDPEFALWLENPIFENNVSMSGYNITADNFFGNLNWSWLESVPAYALITDLVGYVGNWSADKSDYSTTTEANALYYGIGNPSDYYNSSDFDIGDYYLDSNPYSFYNSTNPQTETDPVWTTDKSDYSTTTEANNLYSGIEWDYNQTTPAINKILTFNYYNSSDFDYNDYYLKSNPYSFYNSTDFSIGDYTLTTTINGYSLSHWSDDLGDRGYTNNLNFTNGADYYNSSDFDIGDYYLKSNPFSFYNSTNPQTETDSLAYNGSLYLSSNPYLFYNSTSIPSYILTSNEGSLNVNSANLWDALDAPLSSWTDTYNSTYNTWAYNQTTPAIAKATEIDTATNTSLYNWVVGQSYSDTVGTVTSIATTAPINGGTITSTGTIGLDTATPSNGDTTHASTADQIFDYIVSLNYVANAITSLAGDSSPQLGESLDANGHDIQMDTNNKVCLDGTTCSHYMYYNGTATIIS